VLDLKNKEKDRIIASKVTKNHRYKNESNEDFLVMNETYDEPSMKSNNIEE